MSTLIYQEEVDRVAIAMREVSSLPTWETTGGPARDGAAWARGVLAETRDGADALGTDGWQEKPIVRLKPAGALIRYMT